MACAPKCACARPLTALMKPSRSSGVHRSGTLPLASRSLMYTRKVSLVSWLSVSSRTTGTPLAPALEYSWSRSCRGGGAGHLRERVARRDAKRQRGCLLQPAAGSTGTYRLELVDPVSGADRDGEHLVAAQEGGKPRQRLLACTMCRQGQRLFCSPSVPQALLCRQSRAHTA